MITPDSIALWKQMQALNYKPKAAFFEKGGEPVVWWSILGESAQGTMVAGYWHPDVGYPGGKELRARFEEDTGELYSQHIADAYAAAQVLLDGMERAGSIDPAAVNAAIGETDKTYVVGPVKFHRRARASARRRCRSSCCNGRTAIWKSSIPKSGRPSRSSIRYPDGLFAERSRPEAAPIGDAVSGRRRSYFE